MNLLNNHGHNIKLNINYIEIRREIISCHRGEDHHTPFYPNWFSRRHRPAIWRFKGPL